MQFSVEKKTDFQKLSRGNHILNIEINSEGRVDRGKCEIPH